MVVFLYLCDKQSLISEIMKKYVLDLNIVSAEHITDRYVLLKLTHSSPLPPMLPGQFVEVRVDDSPSTFLRRPISINNFDTSCNELWLLVAAVGAGTRRLSRLSVGDVVNCVLPLGNSFTVPPSGQRALLVGGGVGVAPLLYFGRQLRECGVEPVFLLGARSAGDLLMLDEFNEYGRVCVTTEDGSLGERGFVTDHSVLRDGVRFDQISTCGPKPMMKAVARYAREHTIRCEASLENLMACGLGACLCCVEKTTEGKLCVCKEGPVFDVEKLLW